MGPEVVVAIVAAAAALVTALLSFAVGRRNNSIDAFEANLALSKYIDERVEERIKPLRDEMRLRTGAFIRILRTIARQWPMNAPPPILDPVDIQAVEEAIPPQWLPRPEAQPKEKKE